MNWFKSSRKKESEDYEKEFLSRYKKQQKAKPEKKASKHKKVIEIESDEKNQDGEIKIPATKITVDDSSKVALKQLADLLQKDETLEDLQNSIYSIAKENQVQPKDFFRILYQIILSKDRGPKIGPFIEDIGKKKVADAISKHI